MTMIQLDPREYRRLDAPLRAVPINTLFARSVVEGHVPGRIWVDDVREPRAVYVAHPYGMSLLFGAPDDEHFQASLERYLVGAEPPRHAAEWLQVYPDDWCGVLSNRLGERLVPAGVDAESGRVVRDTRVNFRFDRSRYETLRASIALPSGCSVVDDVDWIFPRMQGSVTPSRFWQSAADLRNRGAASALIVDGELAAVAFASFVIDDMLELGIETVERFRGRGFAVLACCAVIDECLERGLEPVWACRLGNVGSYRLALRLGFVHTRSLPYYRLPPSETSVTEVRGAALQFA